VNIAVEKPAAWDGKTAIILGHGAGQGMNSPFMNYFHAELAGRGFLSVKFNFDYMEEGRKAPDRQPTLQARYLDVIQHVASTYSPRKIVIGGKSMGGRVASYIAGDATGVTGLVFLGYPLHPPGKSDQMRDEHLYSLDLPMLFLSGTKDDFAQRPLLESVIRKIGDRATLHWIEGGDHSLQVKRSGKESWPAAVEVIETWAGPLLPRRG
jgi:predicted alpha/beta-hydrolase family hydrolase